MTKFQRGELMEGWNDCPVPVSAPASGASSASGTLKAKKRMSRLPIVGAQPTSGESSTSSSSRSLVIPPPVSSALPPPPSRIGAAKTTGSVLLSESKEKQSETEVDFEQSEQKLRSLVEEANVTDKEKEFYTKRLVEAFPQLSDQHKAFVSRIVDGIASQQPSSVLKTQILNYMMANSGVSMWGVPLKKLVETMK